MSKSFRPEQLDEFWGFVCERQNIWFARTQQRAPPPWTEDPILRSFRFTNVYRECDPGTDYLLRNILDTNQSDADKIFNVMIYRLIGRKDTYQRIGFQHVTTFDSKRLKETLQYIRDVDKHSPFSGAYTVCSYSSMGSHDKTENVAEVFSELKHEFPGIYARIKSCKNAKATFDVLNSVVGFGRFLAYQVLVDLLYPLKVKNGAPLLPFSHDEWAMAGPGASRGIHVLLKENATPRELDVMRWLRNNQRNEFERLGLDFHYLKDKAGNPIEVSLANIQNCLCEFYKYDKIKTGTGRARRRFTPRTYLDPGQALLETQDQEMN
jgi:hypothetical protein